MRRFTQIKRKFSDFVKIVEVGPRDGLQNEKPVSMQAKLKLIHDLSDTGLQVVEAGSFVSPKWVPQMKDTGDLFPQIKQVPGVSYPCLTPNLKGLELARKAGVKEVAVFTGASATFCKKNINNTIDGSLDTFAKMVELARENDIKCRGYVSCVVGCPYEGPGIDPKVVSHITRRLLEMGCYEVSLGDTIGVGTPGTIRPMLKAVLSENPVEKIAIHCHDTYGQGVANVVAAIDEGIRVVDASVSGLGGCPYAKGASGNVATEDVVYCLTGMGYRTGVDLNKLMETSIFISDVLGRQPGSKVTLANCGTESSACN